MHFDVFTLVMACSLVVFLSGTVLTYFWSRTMRNSWLALWAAAFVMIALGLLVAMLKPGDPGVLRSAVGNAVHLIGFGFVWSALRIFEGRAPLLWVVPIPSVVWVGLVYAPGVYDSLSLRVALISAGLGMFCALGAWELWRGRKERLSSKRPLMILFLFLFAFYLGRILLVDVVPYPYGGGETDALVAAVMAGLVVAASLAATVLLVAMTLERKELAQRELAATDALTGFLNRRGLETILPKQELPAGSALVLFDLDRFKHVNDTFGHAAGDALIVAFARICREELRQVDYAVRLGGEEFALVLASMGMQPALAVAERIRERFSTTVVEIGASAIAGTASGGVYAAPADANVWLSGAIASADRAMYQAKSAGRNRVFTATDRGRGQEDRTANDPEPAVSVGSV